MAARPVEPESPCAKEWQHFPKVVPVADMLPVVCDQSVPIDPGSKLKSLGKAPSVVNEQGFAHGIKGWQDRITRPAQIDWWSTDPRLGICLLTRFVRVTDIDIDHPQALEVRELFQEKLGIKLPARGRSNSRKIQLAFKLPGEINKRQFHTEHGLVEFLGNGQHTVIAGVHKSGVPYEWEGGLPEEIPLIELEAFEEAWAAIEERFKVEKEGAGAARTGKLRGPDLDIDDPDVSRIEEKWETHGYGPRGQLFIACPFQDGHSGDSGESECAYFPAGVGGYEQSHFVCLHASCRGRSDEEFKEAIGIGTSSDFVDETTSGVPGEEIALAQAPVARPPFTQVDVKTGAVPATRDNLEKALTNERWLRARLAFDEFAGDIVISWGDTSEWRPINDNDFERLMLDLERRGFKEIAAPKLKGMVALVADEQRFDSAISWLNGLPWDGVKRVERFLIDFFETEDTPYTRAVSLYWWTAHAARVLQPGAQCDMVPVLVSPEGRFKSTSLQVLAPSIDHFAEIDLALGNADLSRHIKGKLIGELGELQGLRKRERAELKAFVTRRVEEYVPKYIDRPRRYARRLVFVGTTNEAKFLSAETGERRWLPVNVESGHPERLAAARDQLWAEARVMFEAGGVAYREAERLAPAQREDFREVDSWGDAVLAWRSVQDPLVDQWFTTNEALLGIDLPTAQHSPRNQQRMADVLRALGFIEKRPRVDGKKLRAWTTGTTDEPLA